MEISFWDRKTNTPMPANHDLAGCSAMLENITREKFVATLSTTHTARACVVKEDLYPMQQTFYVEASYNLLVVQIEFAVVVVSCARLQV